MPDYSTRSSQIEIMDDLSAGGEIIDVTLKELETINLLLGGNHVTINGVRRLLKNHPQSETITIADLGCGSGDILRLIQRRLGNKYSLKLIGVDANPNIVEYARKQSTSGNLSFEAIDIFSKEFSLRKFNIVTGTLFFHHFTNEQLTEFFRSLKAHVNIGIVINDIHRHWFAYHSIRLLTSMFSKSDMVKHDAPVSVMRAFKKNELEKILNDAGFKKYNIRWMWAFRWQVIVDLKTA